MADAALVLKINFELTEKDFGYFRDLADDIESYAEFLRRRGARENPPNAEELAALREELHSKLALRYAAKERRLSGTRAGLRLLY